MGGDFIWREYPAQQLLLHFVPPEKKPERRNCVKIEAVGVLEKGSQGICHLTAVM